MEGNSLSSVIVGVLLGCIVLVFLNFSASLSPFLTNAPLLVQPSAVTDRLQPSQAFNHSKSSNSAILAYSPQRQVTKSPQISTEVSSMDKKQVSNHSYPNSTSSGVITPSRETTTARKFFIMDNPEMSTLLTQYHTSSAIKFYEDCLNEEAIEIWLHRGFERLVPSRTFVATEATAILIPFYGHFHTALRPKPSLDDFIERLMRNIGDNKSKPHILLCPSNNPQRGRDAGIGIVMNTLKDAGVNVWSVGIERNPSWQSVSPERIIPIPYLVKPSVSSSELKVVHTRKNSSFFYAGDVRPNAIRWSGCNRSMLAPLKAESSAIIKLFGKGEDRISQSEYNEFMKTMEFCLILCGDTPTSRSLASSVIHGCIPLRIGSRLRGLCEKPCKKGFGWTITGPAATHLPYSDVIPWRDFPEVNEAEFVKAPAVTLQKLIDSYSIEKKKRLREILAEVQLGWIYGWGSPVTSNEFGAAADYVWNSFLFMLDTRGK